MMQCLLVPIYGAVSQILYLPKNPQVLVIGENQLSIYDLF